MPPGAGTRHGLGGHRTWSGACAGRVLTSHRRRPRPRGSRAVPPERSCPVAESPPTAPTSTSSVSSTYRSSRGESNRPTHYERVCLRPSQSVTGLIRGNTRLSVWLGGARDESLGTSGGRGRRPVLHTPPSVLACDPGSLRRSTRCGPRGVLRPSAPTCSPMSCASLKGPPLRACGMGAEWVPIRGLASVTMAPRKGPSVKRVAKGRRPKGLGSDPAICSD